MSQPYDVPGATPHSPDDFTWVDLGTNGGYWVRPGTNNKGYNCTEFAMAKLFGERAEWGASGPETVETHEIEQALRDRGFSEAESGDLCGCGDDHVSACAVLYFDVEDGVRGSEPFHVAVFDAEYCDWAEKGNSGQPIRHRQNAEDFPTEPAERARTERVFLCNADAELAYHSDTDIHDGAVDLSPPPPPEAPTWTDRFMNWLFGLLGLLIGWFLRGLFPDGGGSP